MNITEALILLQDGYTIYHGKPNYIYQLLDKKLYMYYKEDDNKHFSLLFIDNNSLIINFEKMLNDWHKYVYCIPISFQDAMKFYYKGALIKRMDNDKLYNIGIYKNTTFSIEDLEANDWIIVSI